MAPGQGPAPAEDAGADADTPGLGEAARRLYAQGGETAEAAQAASRALAALAEAELALARAALPRAALWAATCFALALAGALYLLALLVALLHRAGLDWPAALGIAALLAFASAGLSAWLAVRTWRLGGFAATRRQLMQLLGKDG